jgi:hypothetical protein
MPANPNYLGGRDKEDCSSRPAGAKKFVRHHFNRKELVVVVHTCHSSCAKKRKIEGSWSRSTWAKSKPFPKLPEQKGLHVALSSNPSTTLKKINVAITQWNFMTMKAMVTGRFIKRRKQAR